MGACLLITLPLELVLGARVYRRPKLLLLALLPVVVLFSIWDVVGILREHWGYNPAYVTGSSWSSGCRWRSWSSSSSSRSAVC